MVPVIKEKVLAEDCGVESGRSVETGKAVATFDCTIKGVGLGKEVGVSNTTGVSVGGTGVSRGVGLLATTGACVAAPACGVGLGGTGVAAGEDSNPQLARSKAEITKETNIK